MPQSPRFLGFIVLLGLVASARQTDAAGDPGNVSFEERWQTVPRYSEFICGFKPAAATVSYETPAETTEQIPLPRGLRQQLLDVQEELRERDRAKTRKQPQLP